MNPIPQFLAQSLHSMTLKNEEHVRNIQMVLKGANADVGWVKNSDACIIMPKRGLDMNNMGTYSNITKWCNGLILNKYDNSMLCGCLPLTKEITVEELAQMNLGEYNVEEMFDGAIIRLYYHRNKWFTATNRCFDGSYAVWQEDNAKGKITFEELFNEALGNMNLDPLPKGESHCFVLMHPKNRNVIRYEEASLVHIASFDAKGDIKAYEDCNYGWKRQAIYKFENVSELLTQLENTDIGYILVNKTTQERFKVYSPKYMEIKKLRGNIPNIDYLLLERRYDNTLLQFLKHYPEYTSRNEEIKNQIFDISKRVHRMYLSLYVPGQAPSAYDKRYELITNGLHEIFLNTKEVITHERVLAYLNRLPAASLGFILDISPQTRDIMTYKPRKQYNNSRSDNNRTPNEYHNRTYPQKQIFIQKKQPANNETVILPE
jgi:hypothetical protein